MRTFSKEETDRIVQMYADDNIPLRKIARIFKTRDITIRSILTENKISIDAGKYKRTPISLKQELEIVYSYINDFVSLQSISKKYKIELPRIGKILKNHGYKVRSHSDSQKRRFSESEIKQIIEAFLEFKSIKYVHKLLKIHEDIIIRILNENNIFIDKNRKKTGQYLEKWTKLYGRDAAEKKYEELGNRISAANFGKNNSNYGKPARQGCGYGWKGWYKGIYFRSLRELSYALYLDENDIEWESAETKELSMKYIGFNNQERTCRADFLLTKSRKLIEIKPIRLQSSPSVILKTSAATEFCKNNNLTFEILDFPINAAKIKNALDRGTIKFDRDYEKRFLDYISTNLSS